MGEVLWLGVLLGGGAALSRKTWSTTDRSKNASPRARRS